jgi:flagellar motor switch protein FliN
MNSDPQNAPLTQWLERFTTALHKAAGARPEIHCAGTIADVPRGDPTFLWWRYSACGPSGATWIGIAESSRGALARMVSESAPDDACVRLFDESCRSPGVMLDQPPAIPFEVIDITGHAEEPVRLLLAIQPVSPPAAKDTLLGIELPLTLRFGRAHMPLDRAISLGPGAVIDFEHAADEHVELLVNGHVVARGEAIVVNGNYGVRIRETATRCDLDTCIVDS